MTPTEPPTNEAVPDAARSPDRHDPYAALRFRNFRLLIIGRFIAVFGEQMIGVAIGWELYERTESAFALGLVGLVQVIPVILLSLPGGHIADRFDRRTISIITQFVLMLCSLSLALLSAVQGALVLIYGCLLLIGVARAFNDPARSSLAAQLVPTWAFTNAATWSSSSWQLAAAIGPPFGGFVIAINQSATPVYLLGASAELICVCLLLGIRVPFVVRQVAHEPMIRALAEGVRFVWHTRVLMAAITLDLFAVLFGGATALLPIFARDILQVGPAGLGWLRAAASVGAVLMAIALTYLPPIRRAGKTLLWVVAGFGLATIVFGLSRSFALSLLMLGVLGALDNVSVVIRSTLLLVRTPDQMRGRVSAVNSVFVSASNELGAFESGVAAALFGPIWAVVGGGIGTILVVIAVALIWPEMRRLGRLSET